METPGVRLLHRQAQSNPERHLICFPHAGGNPAPYLKFAEFLPADVMLTVASLQRKGTTLVDLLAGLQDWLAATACGSRILFGHSFGGHIAALLAPAAVGARDLLVLSACTELLRDRTGDDFVQSPSDGTFWELLYDLIYIGGISKEAVRSEALVRLAVDAFRHDLGLRDQMAQMSRSTAASPCLFVVGASDHLVSSSAGPHWSSAFPAAFRKVILPGGHFYFVGREAELVALIFSEASRQAGAAINAEPGGSAEEGGQRIEGTAEGGAGAGNAKPFMIKGVERA